MAKQIVFTTCLKWPDLFEGDALVAQMLEKKGHRVSACPWNGAFDVFKGADLIILRSNWDYHFEIARFNLWLDRIERLGLFIQNSVPVVRKNLVKDYLLDMRASGIAVANTRIWPQEETLHNLFREEGWQQAVIKPQIGASGHLVEKVSYAGLDDWVAAVAKRYPTKEWLVQEFLPEIQQTGELSLVFFKGIYSHAVLKQPQKGEFRVNSKFKGRLKRHTPDMAIIHQAENALRTIEETPLYARIDGVIRDENRLLICEMELNEPGLYLELAKGQIPVFAQAIHSLL